jgi:hypothetical protein
MTHNPVVWVLAASILGFAISAVFSSWLKLSRRRFLIPYVALTSAFLIWFLRANKIDVASLLIQNWVWGIVAGVAVGAFLVHNVRSQPSSRHSRGGELALDIGWLGLAYGIVDALFLNVMPVLAVYLQFGGTGSWLLEAVTATLASLLVTFTYHIGYREFRNKSVILVLVGNALITLAYVLSANPLGAVLSHTAMHVAATLRGPETTIQLPPHRYAVRS